MSNNGTNCTIHLFKPSGNWNLGGRGRITDACYEARNARGDEGFREELLNDNGGSYPGRVPGDAPDQYIVVIPDDDAIGRYLYPVLLLPLEEGSTHD